MTSILGSVGGNTTGGYEVYRASKAALNTLLRSYAVRHPERAVVAMHPGWVRTDMGGEGAAIEVAESVPGMVAALASGRASPDASTATTAARRSPGSRAASTPPARLATAPGVRDKRRLPAPPDQAASTR